VRIAIDARPLSMDQGAGIPTALRSLLQALAALDRENEYFFYSPRDFAFSAPEGFRWVKRLGPSIPGTLWLQSVVPFWLREDRIRLFWGTQHVLPLLSPRDVRMVLTVHDIVYRRYPETMRFYNRWVARLFQGASISRADRVAASTAFTARDLVDYLDADKDRLDVIHLGVGEPFAPMEKSLALSRLGGLTGEGPYILAVGSLEPRKNLSMVFRAFESLSRRWPHRLCLAGPAGWKTDVLSLLSPAVSKRVSLLGYVPRDLLPALYSAADAFVFPSLYEGFGLPPLEAMACGTPVISSDASCLPEVLGDAALYAPPHDADAWIRAVDQVLGAPGVREKMSIAGPLRARGFPWSETARKMLDLFGRAG
jgi:glycosyltransferase involved in cell wall biosynthesis